MDRFSAAICGDEHCVTRQRIGNEARQVPDKMLRSVHFGGVVEELINCKCGPGIVRNEIW